MVVECIIRMGYIGPNTMPTKETAMAFSIKEGTSQTVISRLSVKAILSPRVERMMTRAQLTQ